jgi:hypothetical protein
MVFSASFKNVSVIWWRTPAYPGKQKKTKENKLTERKSDKITKPQKREI